MLFISRCQKYSSIPNECVLIQDPNKPCCQVPYCDFTNPTPFPGGQPTPGPVQQPTPKPGVATVAPYVVPGLPSTPRPGVNTEAPTFTIAPTPKPEGNYVCGLILVQSPVIQVSQSKVQYVRGCLRPLWAFF